MVSVERETFPDLIAAEATVLGYAEAAYWLDVGTPEAFVKGSCDPHGLENHNGMLVACDAGYHPGWKNFDSPSSGWLFSIEVI